MLAGGAAALLFAACSHHALVLASADGADCKAECTTRLGREPTGCSSGGGSVVCRFRWSIGLMAADGGTDCHAACAAADRGATLDACANVLTPAGDEAVDCTLVQPFY